MPNFKKNTSSFMLKGSTLYGSPIRKGPVGDWVKDVKSKIGKWWDKRTDEEKQKATEEYAELPIQSELRRKDISSIPKEHIEAIKNIKSRGV
jgi:hypothetical protein